jgi:hypothetical protein
MGAIGTHVVDPSPGPVTPPAPGARRYRRITAAPDTPAMSNRLAEMTRRDGDVPTVPRVDPSVLIREIERYLAAVALYRELGCQPTWIREWAGA